MASKQRSEDNTPSGYKKKKKKEYSSECTSKMLNKISPIWITYEFIIIILFI